MYHVMEDRSTRCALTSVHAPALTSLTTPPVYPPPCVQRVVVAQPIRPSMITETVYRLNSVHVSSLDNTLMLVPLLNVGISSGELGTLICFQET